MFTIQFMIPKSCVLYQKLESISCFAFKFEVILSYIWLRVVHHLALYFLKYLKESEFLKIFLEAFHTLLLILTHEQFFLLLLYIQERRNHQSQDRLFVVVKCGYRKDCHLQEYLSSHCPYPCTIPHRNRIYEHPTTPKVHTC